MATQYDTILGFKVDSKELKEAEKALSGVQKNLKDVSKGASDMDKKTTTASKNMRRAFNVIKVSAAAAAVAIAATVASVTAMVINNTKAINALGDMAQQIGITTENLSNMRYAADMMAGVAEGRFDMALRRMTRRIQEAAEGGGPAAKAIEAMGLSAKELARLAPDEQFRKIADSIKATSAQGDRLRYVMALMDSEGMPLVNMLAEGSDKIREFEREAEKLGLTITNETAKAAADFQDTLSRLRGVKQGIINDLTVSLLPSLNRFADLFQDEATLNGIRQTATALGEVAVKAVEAALALNNFFTQSDNDFQTGFNTIVGRVAGYHTNSNSYKQVVNDLEDVEDRINKVNLGLASAPKWYATWMENQRKELVERKKYLEDLGLTGRGGVRLPPSEEGTTNPNIPTLETVTVTGTQDQVDAAKRAHQSAQDALAAHKLLQESYAGEVDSLIQQVALFGEIDNRTRMVWETEQGRWKDLEASQKQYLLDLAAAKDSQVQAAEIERASVRGKEMMLNLEARLHASQEAAAAIKSGEIRSQEQLNRFIQDAVFWKNIDNQITAGTLNLTDEQIEKYKEMLDLVRETEAEGAKAFERQMVDLKEVFENSVINSMGTAFDRMFEGASIGFGDLLKDMAKQLAKSMVMNYLMSFMGGGAAPSGTGWQARVTGSYANGAAFNKGVEYFANGGIVNRATAFGMAGGMGVMGEAGPEGILPLSRGSDGKLGVISHGAGNTVNIQPGAVVVNATENPEADAQATAQAIKIMIDTQVNKILADSMRTGNMLNRTIQGRY